MTRRVSNDKLAIKRRADIQKALDAYVGRTINWARKATPGESDYGTDKPRRELPEQALRRSVLWVDETFAPYDVINVDAELEQLKAQRQAAEEAAIKRQLDRSRAPDPPARGSR